MTANQGWAVGPTMHLHLDLHPTRLAVCRLHPDDPVPSWTPAAVEPLVSVTRSRTELSIVVDEDVVPPSVRSERGWRALSVRGPLHFSMTGVLASLSSPLAGEDIPIFVISSFDTDWLLVRDTDLEDAVRALRSAGHRVEPAWGRP